MFLSKAEKGKVSSIMTLSNQYNMHIQLSLNIKNKTNEKLLSKSINHVGLHDDQIERFFFFRQLINIALCFQKAEYFSSM